MALKAQQSVLVGLGVGALVFGVYQNALPTVSDVRSAPAMNTDISRAERQAAWTSAAIVTGVAAITGDATVFIIAGGVLIAMSLVHRLANMVDPTTGKLTVAKSNDLATVTAPVS